MSNKETNATKYGNWVSNKIIGKTLIAGFFTVIVTVLLFILPQNLTTAINILRTITTIFSIFFFVALIYFFVARYILSYTGRGLQRRVLDELITRVQWEGQGEALDIGCGSGVLTISLAKKYSSAKIIGLDYWGKEWDYCKAQCENNAEIEEASDNTQFIKGSASQLPFDDESFDLVVSNMTFHEVGDSKDKLIPISESLRVLKKGSKFVFQDLFKLKAYFGSIDDLMNSVKEMGIDEVHYVDVSNMGFIPTILKLPFMLGTTGILYGRK